LDAKYFFQLTALEKRLSSLPAYVSSFMSIGDSVELSGNLFRIYLDSSQLDEPAKDFGLFFVPSSRNRSTKNP
jgi:hypothetical protein